MLHFSLVHEKKKLFSEDTGYLIDTNTIHTEQTIGYFIMGGGRSKT